MAVKIGSDESSSEINAQVVKLVDDGQESEWRARQDADSARASALHDLPKVNVFVVPKLMPRW